jgi:hypothetical protein
MGFSPTVRLLRSPSRLGPQGPFLDNLTLNAFWPGLQRRFQI